VHVGVVDLEPHVRAIVEEAGISVALVQGGLAELIVVRLPKCGVARQ
jgi:hypothetical protein